jgi:ribosome modulation factor
MNAVQNRRSWHAGWNDGFHGRPYGTSLLATIDALAYASGYTDGKAASSRAETPGTVTP